MTTKNQPLFIQDPSLPDGGYQVSMPGVLLLCASSAYGPKDETTPEGRARALRLVKNLLSAARSGGFKRGELLETLLARGEVSARVKELACECIDAVGQHEAAALVAQSMGGRDD